MKKYSTSKITSQIERVRIESEHRLYLLYRSPDGKLALANRILEGLIINCLTPGQIHCGHNLFSLPFLPISIIITSTNMSDDSTSAASTYRDFLFEDLAKIKNELNMSDGKRKGPRGGVTDPFPSRLHEMLEDTFADGQEHIISWQVHGRCFIIKDQAVFAREMLPTFFKQSVFSSFKRQMNL